MCFLLTQFWVSLQKRISIGYVQHLLNITRYVTRVFNFKLEFLKNIELCVQLRKLSDLQSALGVSNADKEKNDIEKFLWTSVLSPMIIVSIHISSIVLQKSFRKKYGFSTKHKHCIQHCLGRSTIRHKAFSSFQKYINYTYRNWLT